MSILAVIAVCIAFGAWIAIRLSETGEQINRALLSIPPHEWTEDEIPSDRWPS